MRRWVLLLLVLTGTMQAQDLPGAPVSKKEWGAFVVVGAEIVADSVTTRLLYQRHYRENDPIAQPFVRAGISGQIGASLLGAGAAGTAWLILRRMHHEQAAKWFLRSVAGRRR